MTIFEIAKNGIWSKKIICEIDLFDFMSFLGLDFLKFSGPLWNTKGTKRMVEISTPYYSVLQVQFLKMLVLQFYTQNLVFTFSIQKVVNFYIAYYTKNVLFLG